MLIRPCHRVLKAINYLCSQDNSQTTSNLDLMIFFHQKLKDLDLFDTIQQLINDGYITATIAAYVLISGPPIKVDIILNTDGLPRKKSS